MIKEEYILKNNIRMIRRSKIDITQQELANAVGCTRQTIVSLEQGKYNPSLILAMKIAKVLEVTIDELFGMIENI